jgi:lysophosphatidic acid acyltransferase/lysophosphatidylinositol acyltransferase
MLQPFSMVLQNLIGLYYCFRECKNEPSVFSLVRGRPVRTNLLIRRIPMSEVPEDEKEAADWLQKLFQKKVFYIRLDENYR